MCVIVIAPSRWFTAEAEAEGSFQILLGIPLRKIRSVACYSYVQSPHSEVDNFMGHVITSSHLA